MRSRGHQRDASVAPALHAREISIAFRSPVGAEEQQPGRRTRHLLLVGFASDLPCAPDHQRPLPQPDRPLPAVVLLEKRAQVGRKFQRIESLLRRPLERKLHSSEVHADKIYLPKRVRGDHADRRMSPVRSA